MEIDEVLIRGDLFYDYRTNVEAYPKWQAWMRSDLQLPIRCYLFTTLFRGLTLGAHPISTLITGLKARCE